MMAACWSPSHQRGWDRSRWCSRRGRRGEDRLQHCLAMATISRRFLGLFIGDNGSSGFLWWHANGDGPPWSMSMGLRGKKKDKKEKKTRRKWSSSPSIWLTRWPGISVSGNDDVGSMVIGLGHELQCSAAKSTGDGGVRDLEGEERRVAFVRAL